jgi:hypothetical protein
LVAFPETTSDLLEKGQEGEEARFVRRKGKTKAGRLGLGKGDPYFKVSIPVPMLPNRPS